MGLGEPARRARMTARRAGAACARLRAQPAARGLLPALTGMGGPRAARVPHAAQPRVYARRNRE